MANIEPKLKALLVPVSTFLSGALLGAAGGMYVSGLSTSVAASVAGGLLAAGAALVGVAVNNKAQSERHAEQLAHDSARQHLELHHDRSLKRIEREMQFRKELYADAVGASSEIASGLQDFLGVDVDLIQITQPMGARRLSLSKVELICDETTSSRLNEFAVTTAKAIVAASQHHHELRLMNVEAEHLSKLLADFSSRSSQILDLYTAGVRESMSAEKLAKLEQEHKEWKAHVIDARTKSMAAKQRLIAALHEKSPAIQSALDPVFTALSNLTASMKRELRESEEAVPS